MDKPRPAVGVPDHVRFALKPHYAAISRENPIYGMQRPAREKHLRRFDAPSLFIFRVNLLEPTDWILEPFLLRKAECRFDLRTHVGFTDSSVYKRHENNRRNFFYQRSISGFECGRALIGRNLECRF